MVQAWSNGNLGKRDGRYRNFAQKYGYERVIAENWSLGVAFFTAWHGVNNVTVAPINRSMFQFDGASFEIGHRLVERVGLESQVRHAVERVGGVQTGDVHQVGNHRAGGGL